LRRPDVSFRTVESDVIFEALIEANYMGKIPFVDTLPS
jgi:hypothetical protein